MAYIEWIDALSVGVREIDEQHKVLIGMINALHAAKGSGAGGEELGGILDGLVDYTTKHFALEERYFAELMYPGASAHATAHAVFITRVAEFRNSFAAGEASLSDEILDFLRSWLTKHISFEDRKYRSLFNQKGLR